MTQTQKPERLPDELQAVFEQMQASAADNAQQLTCAQIRPVTDWFYGEQWHHDRMSAEELEWLLDWMVHCEDPARFEIGDAVCLHRLEQGRIDACIELAQTLRAQQPDFALGHTLALGQAAKGETAEAIATLERIIREDGQQPPADILIHAYMDLAQLQQQQGSLFKALGSAQEALALANHKGLDEALEEIARFLVKQMVAQGGADEVWTILQPLLGPQRTGLWQIAFEHLEKQLSDKELETGAEALLSGGRTDPVVQALAGRANRSQKPEALNLAYAAALALKAPVDIVGPLASVLLVSDEDRKAELAPLIAASAIAMAESEENRSVKQAQWHRSSVVLLISVARHHGVPEAAVKQWAEDEKLYVEDGVIMRTSKALIEKLHTPPAWLIKANEKAE